MSARNQTILRRDINRLNDVVQKNAPKYPSLDAIKGIVEKNAANVNTGFQKLQAVSLKGDKERGERETAAGKLTDWIQEWRPVVLIQVPGAELNLSKLPSEGATPDDTIRVAEDLKKIIRTNGSAAGFKEKAVAALGALIDSAKKETGEANEALAEESAAQEGFTEDCITANPVLVRGTQLVRAIFGATSPEYKQFIARASKEEEDEIEKESAAGETK
jgi:hypothetical protein